MAMNADTLNKDGSRSGSVTLDEAVFDGSVNEALIYLAVKMQLASRRAGTASTKTRANVSGGGVKPWKQKGTGRARAGSTRSPVWRHGGVVFGPHPRSYAYDMPKKAEVLAIRSAMNLKVRDKRLKVIDSLDMGAVKTRAALDIMKNAGAKSALVVYDGIDKNARLSIRNLKGFKAIGAAALNVFDILKFEDVIVTRDALKAIEQRLSL